jgi:hypothetical protein
MESFYPAEIIVHWFIVGVIDFPTMLQMLGEV